MTKANEPAFPQQEMTTTDIDALQPDALNKLAAELWPESFVKCEGCHGTGFKDYDGLPNAGCVCGLCHAVGGYWPDFAHEIDAQAPLLAELIGKGGWEIRVETLFYDCETFWRCSIRKRDKPVEAIADGEPLCRLRCILKAKLAQNEMEKGKSNDKSK
jgi:hypothetical protein